MGLPGGGPPRQASQLLPTFDSDLQRPSAFSIPSKLLASGLMGMYTSHVPELGTREWTRGGVHSRARSHFPSTSKARALSSGVRGSLWYCRLVHISRWFLGCLGHLFPRKHSDWVLAGDLVCIGGGAGSAHATFILHFLGGPSRMEGPRWLLPGHCFCEEALCPPFTRAPAFLRTVSGGV